MKPAKRSASGPPGADAAAKGAASDPRGLDAAAARAALGRRRALKRAFAFAAAFVVAAGVATALGSGSGDDGYRVRAVFDNASFVIPGEDVKVAGVKVGVVDDVDLTADSKAAVVLRIEDPAFRPFRADARCRVGLQSLIGEQFVECDPTQRRGEGAPVPSPLARIPDGRRGAGQHLLGVEHTTSPVGVDLLNDIMRLPQRERLRIILNELGTGLAANGGALRAAIRRASPALQQADRLVATLADQDRLLGRLVDRSDAVLAPLAERRRDLTGFIARSGEVAAATAERGDALEQNLQRLPAFLRELRPAAKRYGALADRLEPAVRTLAAQAPAVNAATRRLGPLSRNATPTLTTLGAVAERGRRTFPRIRATVDRLNALALPLKPLARDLANVSSSFDRAGGIESVMRFIYFYTGTVNGEDAQGHYIRSGLQVGSCAARVPYREADGCESNFESTPADEDDEAEASTAGLLDLLMGPKR